PSERSRPAPPARSARAPANSSTWPSPLAWAAWLATPRAPSARTRWRRRRRRLCPPTPRAIVCTPRARRPPIPPAWSCRAWEASAGAKARELVEQKGGGARVGVLTPGSGGVFDRELAGVPANDKGIGAAAKVSAQKVLADLAEQHRVETSRPFKVLK